MLEAVLQGSKRSSLMLAHVPAAMHGTSKHLWEDLCVRYRAGNAATM